MAIEKIKILGAVLELPANKQHCQFLPIQPIHHINGPNWLYWQCCLAGRILIFSTTMGADYSIELISIETYCPQIIGHNKNFLGSVGTDGFYSTEQLCSSFLLQNGDEKFWKWQ